MEFQEVVRTRRMVRRFTDEPVTDAQRDRILRNAVRAPSAGFSQGWSFIVLERPEERERYWRLLDGDEEWEQDGWLDGMRTAQLLIIPCSSKAAYLSRYAQPDKGWTDEDEARWPMPYWHMDTAMAVMLMLETAVDEGLGACYFGIPPRHGDEARAAFGIPPEWDPIGIVAFGHAAPRAEGGAKGSPTRRKRTPIEELVHHGAW